jgi:hypothetical protein
MTIVGITGHRQLSDPTLWHWVQIELSKFVTGLSPPLTGVTSLAIGADQLFAETVLMVGGAIKAVIPFASYADTFDGDDRVRFERLRATSASTEVLECTASREACYLAAGRRVVDLSELILAVWDGQSSKGLGGTADVVHYAIQSIKPVIHINPIEKTVSRDIEGTH